MNFFASVFSEEPDSPTHRSEQPDPDHDDNEPPTADAENSPSGDAWSFGGLIQTLASKSESVLENYRRDLEDFSSGLRMETAVIREAASRAVKDLPSSLDAGATVAQESLETVGQAIDDIGFTVWKSTAKIISHGRDSLLAPDFDSSDSDNNNLARNRLSSSGGSFDLKRYSRFDALVRALQSDVNTYVEDPEDLENYEEWKLGFVLGDKGEEIGNLMEENGSVEGIYRKVVPSRTDHDNFWTRYFYRLHKLNQAEEARVKLVKRAISGEEEEDLSWDFDDDDDNDDGYELKGSSARNAQQQQEVEGGNSAEAATGNNDVESISPGEKDLKIESDGKGVTSDSKTDGDDDKPAAEVEYERNVASPSSVAATVSDGGDGELDMKYEEKEASEVKTDNENGGSCKDSDFSVVSSQPSTHGEEDIGWDEIEDIVSNDENKGDAGGSTSRGDLRKRLTAADQEEDLSWDIEDDDEDVKS
ncbi:uncharacterized protein LOC130973107 [Arachis stenosperma]|uniref:uncharacterized protein LOC130973107 n=1 Tax=Arachis stenosperma TaxID=217475 RepID=UPI0025ABF6AD|nr:uncharacterized protein LOC130973107 [Arachis stenosperma]